MAGVQFRFHDPAAMEKDALFRTAIFPICLMVFGVLAAPLIWYTCVAWDGSFAAMLAHMDPATLLRIWPRPTPIAFRMVFSFAVLQALLFLVLPGMRCIGPVTPAGRRVIYKDNGLLAWAVTYLILFPAAWKLGWISGRAVYDGFGSILTLCSLCGLIFCGILYCKGAWFPSGPDSGRTGHFFFDYYRGVELHPRILGFDLKQFVNGRLGIMSWQAIIFAFMARQYEVDHHVSSSMIVVVALQTAYIVKFFYWERGYLSTLDVMHDRFGFYICWGVTTWIPGVYTSQALYLVNHPIELGNGYAALIVAFGLAAIYLNYQADSQRQRVRETQGKALVWGKKAEVIVAKYWTAAGETHENLLLISGWWGVARHGHYLAETAAAAAWTLPCGFRHFLPWFYLSFLTVLLAQRTLRDDRRCRQKYGLHWQQYCERVRWRIVPGIF